MPDNAREPKLLVAQAGERSTAQWEDESRELLRALCTCSFLKGVGLSRRRLHYELESTAPFSRTRI